MLVQKTLIQAKYLSRVVWHISAARGGRETIKSYVLATTNTYFNMHGYIYHFTVHIWNKKALKLELLNM